MDSTSNKKIEELTHPRPSRALPVIFLLVTLAGIFCWRVATSIASAAKAPAAPASAQTAAPRPDPAAAAAPKPVQKPAAKPTAAPAPAAQSAVAKKESTPAAAPQPVKRAAAPKEPADSADEVVTPAPAPAVNAESSIDVDKLNAYLAKHLGKPVPFLYRGERRSVILAAFTETTVTIKIKKVFTLKRAELTPEQLALWQ